ncbi:MAG: hypothetical protein ACYC3H_01545 [Bellilinea sp.]
MQVIIVTAGTYMNDQLRAQKCAAGDVLETREWYAQQMAADGTGEIVGDTPKKPKRTRTQSGSRRSSGRSTQNNPFIG